MCVLASFHVFPDKLYDILKLEYNRVNTNLRAHTQSQQSVCAICCNLTLITRNPLLKTDTLWGLWFYFPMMKSVCGELKKFIFR